MAREDSMIRSTTILAFAVMVASMSSCTSSRNRAPITQDELVRNEQAMFDAAASGDQKPWKKYFADDSMYFDEYGQKGARRRRSSSSPGLFRQHKSCESQEQYPGRH